MDQYVIDVAPLQPYHYASVFTPKSSVVRNTLQHELSTVFSLFPNVIPTWSAERQKLEGHDKSVMAVAFSPDGKTVASESYDRTIMLWEAATGKERQRFETHGTL